MAKNNSSTNYYYNRSRRVGRFMPSKDFGGVGDWIKREVRRDLFTPPPKPRKDFGRKLPKVKPGFGRGLGAAGRFALGPAAWLLWEFGDDFYNYFKAPNPIPNPGNGWYENLRCEHVNNINHSRQHRFGICAGGQGGMGPYPDLSPPADTAVGYSLWEWYCFGPGCGVVRGRTKISYERVSNAVNAEPKLITGVWAPVDQPVPRRYRRPPPWDWPKMDEAPDEEMRQERSPVDETSPAEELEISPNYQIVVGPPGLTALPPAGRRPPPKHEREAKMMTRRAKLGFVIYRALDTVSERAEIVDAFYEALPPEVRKRRLCSDATGYRRTLDTLGQYGIDQADCKLRVLYDNWHLVDFEAAIKGVVRNYIADEVIGRYQRLTPKNTGSAHELGEREFAQLIDDLMQEIGL